MSQLYDFVPKLLTGEDAPLRTLAGKVLLIVNTASACGFTPQYRGLEALQKRYAAKGFSVLAFPCNQFGGQEPGMPEEIASFCATQYGVSFPIFAKVEVNGAAAHPLFRHLRAQKGGLFGDAIKWNFTKFLIDRNGEVVARHGPLTNPVSLSPDIEALL